MKNLWAPPSTGITPAQLQSAYKLTGLTSGGSSLPRFNAGGVGEQALDIDAVSVSCADRKIIVVQAESASFTDLGTAAVTASKQSGVAAISNSYGGYGAGYDRSSPRSTLFPATPPDPLTPSPTPMLRRCST